MLNSFRIGNFEDSGVGTGITVILAPYGAVGGVSVRGKAPATRETDLLRSENSVQTVNAVVLSGGSAYGLDACSGVMEYFRRKSLGYNAGAYRVPIVVGASLYDLEYKCFGYPDKEMGLLACEYSHMIDEMHGAIGAGAGATVGKILGMACAQKAGLGVSVIKIGGVELSAIVAVNAFGNVYKRDSKEILAGANKNGEYLDIEELLKKGIETNTFSNTTIGCIVTNAKLTKSQCNSLADCVHDAYARCIHPVHTALDGDCIFVLASNEVDCNLLSLQSVAVDLMSRAIESSVAGE